MIREAARLIAEEKEWSWSVIGLLAIMGGLFIRGFLLRDMLRGIRTRNRDWYRRAQSHYQGRAFLGWLFFALFVAGVMLLWRFEAFFVRYLTLLQWELILAAFFIVSLFCHLRAYAHAMVEAVEEHVASDKDF